MQCRRLYGVNYNQIGRGHGAYIENGIIYANIAGIVQKADK